MKTEMIRERPVYTGKCAGLHKTIAVGNNSEPVDNAAILEEAAKSRASFYETHFKVLNNIKASAEAKNTKR